MTENLEQGHDDDRPLPDTPRVGSHILPPMWLVNLVAVVILVVWVASLAVRISWPDRTLPQAVDALMLMVAGFLFAGNLKDRFTGGK